MPSVSEKPKLTFLPEVEAAAGPESIVGTAGGVASTVHVRETDALVLPCVSTARKKTVCEPSPRLVYAFALVQETNAPESSLHSKVAVPSRVGEAEADVRAGGGGGGGAGVDARVGGAIASTVQVRLVVDEVLPWASRARTSKVCEPSLSPP